MAIGTVTTTHPDYIQKTKICRLIRAILANNAKEYIHLPDSTDAVRLHEYREGAILTNFTHLTKEGLKGLVYSRPVQITLPSGLEFLNYDANGEGLSLEQLSMKMLDEVLTTGNIFALVDYPRAAPDLSILDQEVAGFKSRIKLYTLENTLNFKCRHIGSKYVPWLIVLREFVDSTQDSMFSWTQAEQYRVLMLDDNNNYCQFVLNPKDEIIEDVTYPRDAEGNYFHEIPFSFIGANNNDYCYDDSPLHSLAVVNLGHYRNSADYEESVFLNGQPCLVLAVGDSSVSEFNEANPQGVKFGSRSALVLGTGGSASLLQANPNQLADNAMKRKEEQAAAIGARLIAPPGGRETAEGARIRYGSQNSSLHISVSNIEKGLTNLCQWAAKYEGVTGTIKIQINKEFYDENADPNLLMAQIQMLDKGLIAKSDVREYARRSGIISLDRTDAMIDSEATVLPVEVINPTDDNINS